MSSVDKQHLIMFSVGGKEIQTSISSFRELSVIENVSQKLPTLKFQYSDHYGDLIKNPLSDGTEIAVVMHSNVVSDPEPAKEETYRAMGAEYVPLGNRYMVRCAGIFDRMEYLSKIQKMPIKGNAHEAMKETLGKVNFSKFNFDATNDKMWWRPSNQMQKIEGFVNTIAKHGHGGKEAVMSFGISSDGTAHYKDISKLAKQTGSRKVTEVDRANVANGDIPLVAWKIISLGGATNALSGYGATVKQEKLTGVAEALENIAVPLFGGALNMSSALRGGIGDVIRQYVPTDLGNCLVGNSLIATEYGLLRLENMIATKNYKAGYKENINIKVGSRYKAEKAAVWIYNGKKPTILISTDLGNELETTYKHPYLVFDPNTADLYWKTARQCQLADLLCVNLVQITRNKILNLNLSYRPKRHKAHQIKNRKDVTTPKSMTSELAFILGMIVAEGYVNDRYIIVSNSDEALNNKYIECFTKVFGITPSVHLGNDKGKITSINGIITSSTKKCFVLTVGSVEIVSYMKQLGLYTQKNLIGGKKASWFKFIPWSILQADKQSQLAFLAAYLEGDGSIDNKTGRVYWYSRSETLLKEMQVVLNSHGLVSRFSVNKTCNSLVLNADNSNKFWKAVQPYMVTKRLLLRNNCSIEGVPTNYWVSLLKDRRVYVGGLKTGRYGSFYKTDKNTILNINWKNEGLRGFINGLMTGNTKKFYYKDYSDLNSDLHKFIKVLKTVSKASADRLINLLKLRYTFTSITKVAKGSIKAVYDLSMRTGVEPAFIANGLIVHNTHDKYYQAKEQNVRGAQQLQSTKIEFTTNQATGIKIYDVLDFRPHDVITTKPLELFSGSYTVTSKTRYIAGAKFYREKFTLVSGGGFNQSGQVGYQR